MGQIVQLCPPRTNTENSFLPATVAIFLELRQKATAFQLQLLRDNLLVADEVKGAFDTLFQVMQDQLQVFAASTEVLWAVEVSTFLPNPENEPREERLLLRGKTPMGELAKTKCIMDLYGEVSFCGSVSRNSSFSVLIY